MPSSCRPVSSPTLVFAKWEGSALDSPSLGIEKKAVMSRKWGRLVGFLYLWHQCLVSHEV